MAQTSTALNFLRLTLEDLLPAPCPLSEFKEWCANKFDAMEILRFLEAEVVTGKCEPVIVAYRPEPALEERVLALITHDEPLNMEQIRGLFRMYFPGVSFREPSLLIAMSLDPRIERLPNHRFRLRRRTVPAPLQVRLIRPDDDDDEDDDVDFEDDDVDFEDDDVVDVDEGAENLIRSGLLATDLSPVILDETAAWGIVWEKGIQWISSVKPMEEEVAGSSDLIPLGEISLSSLSLGPRAFKILTRNSFYTVKDVLKGSGQAILSLDEFRRSHRQDLMANLRGLIPAIHPARSRINALETALGQPKDHDAEKVVAPVVITNNLLEGELDDMDLTRAIDQLPDGGILRLGITKINLKEPIVISKALTIQGQGAEHSLIVYQGVEASSAVLLTGEGPWTLTDLTIRIDITGAVIPEDHWNHALNVLGGTIEILRCCFQGAVQAGLLISGATKGRVAFCDAEANETGIWVSDDSTVTLEGNRLYRNRDDGIVISDRATCLVRCNESFQNVGCGIWITQQSQPTLENNRCVKNEKSGISFQGESKGQAIRNDCLENEIDGILVQGQAEPILESNRCLRNEGTGIHFVGKSQGIAKRNECCGNQGYGFLVMDQTSPNLEGNLCNENLFSGICFTDESKGSVTRNDCRENELDGIAIIETADPTIEDNLCQRNESHGICFTDDSRGFAARNVCRQNGLNGIAILERALPTLESNRCMENGTSGYYLSGSVAPVARGNLTESQGPEQRTPIVQPEIPSPQDKAQIHRSFIQAVRAHRSPEWFNSFLDLLRNMFYYCNLTSDDPRLSLSLTEKGHLNVRVGDIQVLTPSVDGTLQLILPTGLDIETLDGTFNHGLIHGEIGDPLYVVVPLNPDEGIPYQVKVFWLRGVSEQLKEKQESHYRKYHLPVFFDVVVDKWLRKQVLLEAFS